MLLHILNSFQAILGMLSAFEMEFFHNCYYPLGDLNDDMALLNSAINFLIYYFMSKQFRKNFLETFKLSRTCRNAKRTLTNFCRNHFTRTKINSSSMSIEMKLHNHKDVSSRQKPEPRWYTANFKESGSCQVSMIRTYLWVTTATPFMLVIKLDGCTFICTNMPEMLVYILEE